MTVRRLVLEGLFALLLTLSGCGGGSSSTPAPEAVCTGGPPAGLASPGQNSQPVYESTCPQTVNIPVVTLTICVPGNPSNCREVPNILLDFGSTGLRLSHTLAISGELPQETANGQPLTECYYFESGYNYGPVVSAAVTLGKNTVTVPVQISNSSLSAPCGSLVSPSSSSAPFEPTYNGILGVLFPRYDYIDSDAAVYFAGGQIWDPAQNETVTVQNPVYLLTSTSNNNGVLLSISTTVSGTTGAPGFTGTLTFGAPSGGTSLQTDQYGEITATYNSNTYTDSAFFDTGSNGFFIDNPDIIPNCSGNLAGFFCGDASGQTVTFSSCTQCTSSSAPPFTFSIVSAQTLLSTGNTVFSTLGGYQQGIFDAGFPAFLYGNAIGLSWINPSCSPNANQGQGCFVIVPPS